jgi:ribonuclease J
MFEREIGSCTGRFFVTTMSSNISRWRQAAQAAIRHGRRIAISGKSIERNIKVATRLGYLNLPASAFVEIDAAKKLPPKNVCVLIAGSQAQSGSALERLSMEDHKDLKIDTGDKVVFSSDYIPGNESAVQALIDSLAKLGASVIYSGLTDNLHVSGHGSQQDLLLLANLTRPQYALPIGGTYRHMVQYSHLIQSMGYDSGHILLPEYNQSIEVTSTSVKIGPSLEIKNVMVDGLGIGDVGNIVLRDRQILSQEGILVVVTQVDQNNLSHIINLDLISRGFVFEKQNEALLNHAAQVVRNSLKAKSNRIESTHHLRQIIVDTLERFLFAETHRRPMILPVIIEV